uniref:Integrin beta n=1 Tax=Panagrolaimus superbus TaxID=310955 RepID=A0A914YYI0_9BILA
MRQWVFIFLFIAIISCSVFAATWEEDEATSDGEVLESSTDFPCHSLSPENYTCSACIQFHDTCAWCADWGFNNQTQFSRCDSRANLLENGCPQNEVVFPKTTIRNIENEDLRDGDENIEDIQIRPQEVDIQIRPKSRARFFVTFRQAANYPVDLYYLMDLSYSMKDDKEKLSQLGDLLAERMKQITRNFRLGFGSFIDKKVMPFVDPRKEKQVSPCSEGCAPTYGFRNQMGLTIDTNKFAKEVDKALISGNLDAPEGGFDAIMQAISCNDSIGWRDRSRKMIVFSTDAGFHYAGDGRLAGIVTPNDGQCHLDREGYYTKSIEQDYPSIALLHQKIKEKKVNMIFAVTQNNRQLYDQLSNALPDVSSSVGVLANDSSNIVQLVEQEYEKIAEKIIMVDNANSSMGLKLSYRSRCLVGEELVDTNVCDGIKVNGQVGFEVTLEATHCVKERDFTLKIGPSGLDDSLRLNVHVICDCDCEREVVYNAPECHGRGTLACGICQCAPGFVGKHCECDSGGETAFALESKCRKDNSSLICSGRGTCECGVCKCFQRTNPLEQVTGQFCECDNFNCPRHDRKLCGGHGKCNCGVCECEPGYTGRACECPTSTDSCLSKNGKICNGHGDCICGKCHCHTDEDGSRYSGPFCDICPTCPSKCVEYKPCVMCQQWGTGIYNESKCAECPFDVIPVKELPVLNISENAEDETWKECQFVDPSDDCTFYFLYYYDGRNNLTVWVKEDKDCPAPLPVLVIVLIVIAGIVILGLLLLCLWKILTMIYDRREYAKFEKERLNARWEANENPIYKQATTTFKNPVYAGEAAKNK